MGRYLNVSHNTKRGAENSDIEAGAAGAELLIRKNSRVVGVRDPRGTAAPIRYYCVITVSRGIIIVYNGRANLCKQNDIIITSYDDNNNHNNNHNGFRNSSRNEHIYASHYGRPIAQKNRRIMS